MGEVVDARIAATETGEVMAVWEQVDDIWYARFASDQWEPPSLLEASSDSADGEVVAADGNGNFVVSWCQAGDVRTRRFLAADQRWEDLEILYASNSDRLLRPSLQVGPEEEASLVWVVSHFVEWSYFVPASRWSASAKLSDALEAKDPPTTHAPWVGRAADGTLAVVWGDGRSVWAWADRR